MNKPQESLLSTNLQETLTQMQISEDIYTAQAMCGSDTLYEVKEREMKQRLHRFMVAIIWRTTIQKTSSVGKGSGILISPNLILTVAHNFFHNKLRVQNQLFEIYVGQWGKMQRSYKIENIFIPKEYDPLSKTNFELSPYDYALVKLTERVKEQGFIGLGVNYNLQKEKLAIFGYPGSKYYISDKILNIQGVNQWGLIKENSVAHIRLDRSQLLHYISTLPGHSGCPIIWIQNLKVEKLTIVGIHKGGIQFTSNGNKVSINAGTLITEDILTVLLQESIKMKADRFNIEEKQSVAKILVEKGNKLWNTEKSQCLKVIEYYLSSLKIYADYGINLKLIPFIRQFKDKKKLVQQYRNQLKDNSDNFDANFILGLVFQAMGEKLLEKQHKEQAVKCNALLQIGWNSLANLYDEDNLTQKAIECFKKALEINPKYAIAYNNLGTMFSAINKKEKAIESYRKAISINPNFSGAYYNLGKTLFATNSKQQGIECFRKAIKINPQDSDSYNSLGAALYVSNKKEQGVACYRKAIQINPLDSNAYNNLASAYEKMNDMESAVTYYHLALQIDPTNQKIQKNFNSVLEYFRKAKKVPKGFEKYFTASN